MVVITLHSASPQLLSSPAFFFFGWWLGVFFLCLAFLTIASLLVFSAFTWNEEVSFRRPAALRFVF